MTYKHAAGPWDWHGPYMTGAYKVSALHPEGGQSLDVMIQRSEDNLANARLIAAAPDLLAALDQLELCASQNLGIGGGQAIPAAMMNSQIGKAIAQARATLFTVKLFTAKKEGAK